MKRTMTKCWLWMLIAVFLGLMGAGEVWAAANSTVTISPDASSAITTSAPYTTSTNTTFTVTVSAGGAACTGSAPAWTTGTKFSSVSNSCVAQIAAGGTCTIVTKYTPTTTSGTDTDTLTVTWTDDTNAACDPVNWKTGVATDGNGGSENWTIDFTGTALPAPTPTMNEWGMIIFMVFAGIGSIIYFKRYSFYRS
ncbi:MAG: hypothetical protein H7843_12170 [Nitrospirota bacterium]